MDRTLCRASNVLLSGATGFIGGELLRALSARVDLGRIWTVIRPTADQDPTTRLTARLLRSGDSHHPSPNIRAIPGDIVERDWGLGFGDLSEIAANVDFIIHSAADTSFAVRKCTSQTNIRSVERLVNLARAFRHPPLIVYISSAANVGDVAGRCVTEHEALNGETHHHNEYTYSKAVGERILRESGLPILILRPTIVFSAGLPDATFARQILWCAPLTRIFNALPVDPAARIDLVDIGFVANAAIRLLTKAGRRHDTYFLSAGRRGATTAAALNDLVAETYGRRSRLELIPPAAWGRTEFRANVRSALQRRVYRSLRTYLPFLNMDVVYDDTRLKAELGPARLRPRPVSEYLPELLGLIGTKAALKEAALP